MYVDLNAVLRFKIMKCSKNTKKKEKERRKTKNKKAKKLQKRTKPKEILLLFVLTLI